MIHFLADIIANYFFKYNYYSKEELPICSYGFEVLLSVFFNSLCLFTISVLFNHVAEMFIFCFAFIPLRLFAGGFHANHHYTCILFTNIIFILFIFLESFILEYVFYYHYYFITLISLGLSLFLFSPVEIQEKTLSNIEKIKMKKLSLSVFLVDCIIISIFFSFDLANSSYCFFFISGLFLVTTVILLGMLKNISIMKGGEKDEN